MLKQNPLQAAQQYQWPENYYRETDALQRRKILLDRIEEEKKERERRAMVEEGKAVTNTNSEENRLRLLLWENRYLNEAGKQDGVDYYLKTWNELKFAAEKADSFFGKKSLQKVKKRTREVFQFDVLKESSDYWKVWYDEYVQFCCFYIQICQTDKSYTSVLFNLAKISEENLTIKIAQDLYEKTIVIPEKLGMEEDFELLAKAARDSFVFYYPKDQQLYEELNKCTSRHK